MITPALRKSHVCASSQLCLLARVISWPSAIFSDKIEFPVRCETPEGGATTDTFGGSYIGEIQNLDSEGNIYVASDRFCVE